MLLENKNAVIYGAGEAIGGAVSRAFAREGARVFLTSRTLESLEEVAEEIRSAGGLAETAQVDALDEMVVDEHTDTVAASAGGIDISFNLISYGDVQGTPLVEMPLEDFERPVATAVRTQFLTSRAAARHMVGVGLPSSQLAVLSGTTHVGLVERAGWLLSMIGEFLDAPMPEAELSTDSSETR
jgi:3-oxoacyl-[acyl-carrier protein] reductase